MINCLYFQLREKIAVLEYDDGIYKTHIVQYNALELLAA
jgi:hypothetical protein